MANRLSVILLNLVSEEQVDFVCGRNIAPHIVMAQELVRDIDRKSTGAMYASNWTWRKDTVDLNGDSFSNH